MRHYTNDDMRVWQKLFANIEPIQQAYACEEYLNGLKELEFTPKTIPQLEQINEVLEAKTGWTAVESNGIVPDEVFLDSLAQKKFPVTTWLRPLDRMFNYDDADLFHDGLAHLPLLTNQVYADFLHGLAQLKGVFTNNITELGRIYWRTIETGLIQKSQDKNPKLYGAALLSSGGESVHSVSKLSKKKPFHLLSVVNESYRYDQVQEHYYLIDSFNDFMPIVCQTRDYLNQKNIVWAS